MTEPPPLETIDLFDEAGYLRLYPGLAEAMMRGQIASARSHFLLCGQAEGRRPNDVDPSFYFSTYPEAAAECDDAAQHYLTLGRARGYLPNAAAPRALNGAAYASPFGGFWTDQANALDLIQGRVTLGQMRRRDAAYARRFAIDGFVEMDQKLDGEALEDGRMFVDQIFTGLFPDMRYAADPAGEVTETWRPELLARPVAALDPHMFSGVIRAQLLDSAITEILAVLFGAPVKLTASRAWLSAEAAPDRDAAWFAYSLPLQFVAVTFFYDAAGSDDVSVWPGSHLSPDQPWPGGHVSLSEARRAGQFDEAEARARRQNRLNALLELRTARPVGATAGSRVIRLANLIHAARPPEFPGRVRSLTAWYCPAYVTPLYMETTPVRTHAHDNAFFCSGVYPGMDLTC